MIGPSRGAKGNPWAFLLLEIRFQSASWGLRLRRVDKEDRTWSVRTVSTSGKEPVKPRCFDEKAMPLLLESSNTCGG